MTPRNLFPARCNRSCGSDLRRSLEQGAGNTHAGTYVSPVHRTGHPYAIRRLHRHLLWPLRHHGPRHWHITETACHADTASCPGLGQDDLRRHSGAQPGDHRVPFRHHHRDQIAYDRSVCCWSDRHRYARRGFLHRPFHDYRRHREDPGAVHGHRPGNYPSLVLRLERHLPDLDHARLSCPPPSPCASSPAGAPRPRIHEPSPPRPPARISTWPRTLRPHRHLEHPAGRI